MKNWKKNVFSWCFLSGKNGLIQCLACMSKNIYQEKVL